MGKALIAVGSLLAVFFIVFGGVVYVTRDEDTYAVDAALSEGISKAVAEAEENDENVDLRNLADFDFDEVVIFDPSLSRDAISDELGFEFKGELRYRAETTEIFVFLNHGQFVRFADYRGRGRFDGLDEPFAHLSANDAVFRISNGVATPL
jgi:hypothetical protein